MRMTQRMTQSAGIDRPGMEIAAMVIHQLAPRRRLQRRRRQHREPVGLPMLVQETVQLIARGLILRFHQQQSQRMRARA
jgi:hypothetical protein